MTTLEAMRRAIEEARRGTGFVSPNPLVGCVILDREGDFLVSGYHARLGDLHAEIHALAKISDRRRLEGAHVVVTLEPCAHHGRQPSCAMTLATLPIARVTYGLDDPDPRVSGRGVHILREAGISVERFTELNEELEELAEIFLVNQRQGRAFVTLKVAASLDGKVARPDGESQWITGPMARARVHAQRGAHDVVLTGSGTIVSDEPRLNSRDERYAGRPQRLAVLDPRGALATGFDQRAFVKVRTRGDIIWMTGPGVSSPPGVVHSNLRLDDNGRFDLRDVVDDLYARDLRSIFVEAGPRLTSAFLEARLVDRIFVFLAPILIGRGQSWTSTLETPNLAQALRLDQFKFETVGQDVLATAKVQR